MYWHRCKNVTYQAWYHAVPILNVIDKKNKPDLFSCSVCLSWQRLVSVCVLLLLSCPAETKSRRARKQRLGCWAQNLLSKHQTTYSLSEWISGSLWSPPLSFVQPSQDLLAYCCRQFLGRRDQRQARVINPHHWGLHVSAARGMAVSCHELWRLRFINWMKVEWFLYSQFW